MELLNPLVLAEYLETEASETFPSQDAARSVQKAIDAAEYTIAVLRNRLMHINAQVANAAAPQAPKRQRLLLRPR